MVRKTNSDYGNDYIGLHVPEEFHKKIMKFLKEYNKEFRAETGRKIYKSELFVLAANQFMKNHEKNKN